MKPKKKRKKQSKLLETWRLAICANNMYVMQNGNSIVQLLIVIVILPQNHSKFVITSINHMLCTMTCYYYKNHGGFFKACINRQDRHDTLISTSIWKIRRFRLFHFSKQAVNQKHSVQLNCLRIIFLEDKAM